MKAVIRFSCLLSLVGAFGLCTIGSAQDQKPAGDAEKITYDDQIKPIFREHCFNCHNQDGKKGGLALDSFAKAQEGGSSGQVVFAGDLESSRLWGAGQPR